MTRSRAARGAALPVGLAAAALAILAIGGMSRASTPGPSPSAPAPVVTPSPIATPIPSPVVTPRPSPVPSQPAPETAVIDLEDPLGHDVTVVLDDESGRIVRARSGHPGDGMSVRWYGVDVSLVDDDTVRLTWVGLPGDVEIGVVVAEDAAGRLRMLITQPIPPRNSDALGVDRVLELDLGAPVSAADVVARIVMD